MSEPHTAEEALAEASRWLDIAAKRPATYLSAVSQEAFNTFSYGLGVGLCAAGLTTHRKLRYAMLSAYRDRWGAIVDETPSLSHWLRQDQGLTETEAIAALAEVHEAALRRVLGGDRTG